MRIMNSANNVIVKNIHVKNTIPLLLLVSLNVFVLNAHNKNDIIADNIKNPTNLFIIIFLFLSFFSAFVTCCYCARMWTVEF